MSNKLINQYNLTPRDIDRIIGMAWEDRTPFDAIEAQFGMPEKDVIKLMRSEMHPNNWRKWRARVQGRSTKHRRKRGEDIDRFRSNMQKHISQNRASKPR